MQRHARLMCALAVPFALAGGSAAHAVILNDDFDGAAIDGSKWATSGGTIALDGAGNLVAQTGNGSHSGATIASQASDLNFFDQPLTFQLNGLDFGGTGVSGGRAMGYLAVGLASPNDTWAYKPTPAPNGQLEGIMLAVTNPSGNEAAPYSLRINLINGGSQVSSGDFGINGLPTGISLMLDGSAGTYQVTLEGAEFQWGGDDEGVGAVRTAALPVGMTESSFVVEGTYITRMAFGAYNFGQVDPNDTSSLTVGSASVIPEPATLGLIGAGLLLAVGRKR